MDRQNAFPALTRQTALACGLFSVAHLLTLEQGGPIRYFPLVLLPAALAVYAVNDLFLRRSRTMRAVVLLNAAIFAALFASVLFVEGIVSWGTLALQGGFCLWITVWGARCCMEPPDLRSLIASLDVGAALLLFYTAFLLGADLPILWCAPAAAGCAASVLGLIARRVDRPLEPKEWGILLLVFSGLSAVVWLLVAWAAAPAGHGLVALWNALIGALRWMAGKLWAMILFLLSLLPEPKPEELTPMEPAALPSAEEMTAVETSPILFIILMVVIAAAVLAAFVFILHRLGKLRIGGWQETAAARRRSDRISLWQALRRLWLSLKARLRQRIFLRRIRNTPEGLFYLLVRRCRMSPWHKRAGETPREFLTRLRDAVADDRELFTALDSLIPAVDTALYAPFVSRRTHPAARLIRRRFGAVSRRSLLRRGQASLRMAFTRWRRSSRRESISPP